MSQPPPVPPELAPSLPGKISGTVRFLGVLASGFQALVLPLVTFGGVTGSTKTLALLGYEGLMRAAPESSGAWFQFGLVAVLGLAGGILLVISNVRCAFGKTSASRDNFRSGQLPFRDPGCSMVDRFRTTE